MADAPDPADELRERLAAAEAKVRDLDARNRQRNARRSQRRRKLKRLKQATPPAPTPA